MRPVFWCAAVFALGFAVLTLAQNQIPTAVYPANVVTDEQLKVQTNNIQTSLIATFSTTATFAAVASCGNITGNMFVIINQEVIAVSGCSGAALNVDTASPGCTLGRGCDGTAVAAHPSGAAVQLWVVAWHHNAVAKEVEAIETALGPNLSSLKVPAAPGSGTWCLQAVNGTISWATCSSTGTPALSTLTNTQLASLTNGQLASLTN